jgi:hypothetical protein
MKPLWASEIGTLLRNELDFRPIRQDFPEAGVSISDLHYWRVADEFQTKYVMTDVIFEYLGIGVARYFLNFLDTKGDFLFRKELEKSEGKIEALIDSGFMGVKEGDGCFYLTIICPDVSELNLPYSFKNRWYTGYKVSHGPFSMVHGNTLCAWNSLDGSDQEMGLIKSTVFRRFPYFLQFDPSVYDSVELIFVNPCSKRLKISFEGSKSVVPPFGVVTREAVTKSIISFSSNCKFLRPIVIGIKNEFVDCFHG